MFGRTPRHVLIAQRDAARAELDATRHPRTHAARAAHWLAHHPLIAVTLTPVIAATTALALTVVAARAWWKWPIRTTLAATAAVTIGWTLPTHPLPWWAALPLLPTAVAAAVLTDRRRPRPTPPVTLDHEYVATWRTQVADPTNRDAPAPASTVADNVTTLLHPDGTGQVIGRVLHVTGADSSQHAGWFRTIVPRLSYVYGVDEAAITCRRVGNGRRIDIEILDQWYVDERNATRRARITTVQPWAGPSLGDDGTFRVLTAAIDGRGACGQLWIPAPRPGLPGGGARNIDVSGLQGSGKSNAVNVINASILARGLVVMDLVDLKGGTSLPAWRQVAWRYGTSIEAGLTALLRWNVIIDTRTDILARLPRLDEHGHPVIQRDGRPAIGVEGIDPSTSWPVVVLEIDEFPQLARRHRAKPLIKRGLERSRSVQCALAPIHQGTALADGYGDDTLTRNLLTNGTVLALRNGAESTPRVVSSTSTVKLETLGKDTPGEALLTSTCEPQPVHGRVEYLEDPWAAAARCIPGTLDEGTAMRVAVLEAFIDRLGVDRVADLYIAEPDRWEQACTAVVADLDAAATAAAEAAAAEVAAVQEAGQPADTVGEQVGPKEAAIRDVFRAAGVGVMLRTGQVMTAANVTSSTFHQASKRLVAAGLIVDLGPGQWAATAALAGRDRTTA